MHLIIFIVLIPRKLSPNPLSLGKLLLNIQVIFLLESRFIYWEARILENNCICRRVGRGCKGLQYYLSYLDGDASLCVICIYYHNICEGLGRRSGGTRDQRITQNYSFGFSLMQARIIRVLRTFSEVLSTSNKS